MRVRPRPTPSTFSWRHQPYLGRSIADPRFPLLFSWRKQRFRLSAGGARAQTAGDQAARPGNATDALREVARRVSAILRRTSPHDANITQAENPQREQTG